MNKSIENKPRLLDQVQVKLRLKHYSYRTEQSYIAWIKRFIFFHNKQHPDTKGEKEIESFLTHLAVKRNVAASTQNQALCALLFLYRDVLGRELAWLESMQRAKRPARLPAVLTVQEVHNLLNCLEGRSWLMASLLYTRQIHALYTAWEHGKRVKSIHQLYYNRPTNHPSFIQFQRLNLTSVGRYQKHQRMPHKKKFL